MQFVESSIVGLRSAVITLTHRASPLTFILFPMVHVAERQFYDEVAARARSCQLIVAEGMPAKYAPAHEWMARHRWGHLVDQVAALHLETLGVPVRWESWPDDQPKSFREELMFHAADVAGAAVLGLTRQITDLMAVASVDQAEEYDQSALNLTGGKLDRLMEYRIKTARDAKLVRILGEIHHDRAAEPIKAGVVFGAAHMPAVAAYLCGQLGYVASSADWLIVAHARSLRSQDWVLARAWSKSAIRSCAPSMPQLTRIRSSVMPSRSRSSGLIPACEVVAGRVISVSTPPRLGATYGSLTASRKVCAAASPPRSRMLSMPPKPDSSSAACLWSGWEASPA